jgi:hypothetical protein
VKRRGVVGLVVVAGAALLVALLVRGVEAPAIARTTDGLREIRTTAYGKRIDYLTRRDGFRFWTWGRESWAGFPMERLLVHVRGQSGNPVYEASCGCRFEPDGTAGSGDADVVYASLDFPRRDRTLRMRFGQDDAAVAEFPNPFPAPPAASDEGVVELPVTTAVGDETWILSHTADAPPQFAVRPVDAGRSGFEWTFEGAWFSDASGNRIRRVTDGRRSREHRIAAPQTQGPFVLCPHEPWWELELELGEGRTVRWRFRPLR